MSVLNRILVCYDISDDERRGRIHKTLRGYGEHVQYSTFLCDLSPQERVELAARLDPLVHHTQDQILFVGLGPAEGRGAACIASLGRPVALLGRRVQIF